MKNNKGITLIALVITIIILLILTSIVTVTSMDTYEFANMTKFVAEMQLIQKEVDRLVEGEYNLDELGEGLTESMKTHLNEVSQLRRDWAITRRL